jgi:fumarylacetoacetate (FAA) hydrolase
MKLTTLRDGSRDGQLAVVSRDLRTAHLAHDIAPNLQRALDDWGFIAPQLEALSLQLDQGKARYPFALNTHDCLAPLPRAYQWADASTYPTHIERVLGARGVPVPEHFAKDYLMYQGGSDSLLGPHMPAVFAAEALGIDFEAEIVVVTGDIPMGAGPQECEQRILLVGLVNDWSLRELVNTEVPKGFGFFQSKPATAFSPCLVTLDELGELWTKGRPAVDVTIQLNGNRVGRINASGMIAGFGQLIAHAARTRDLAAGTIVGAGTVSEADAKAGFACLAEKRAVEIKASGVAQTEYLRFGDVVKIDASDAHGKSLFGAIEQTVTPLSR